MVEAMVASPMLAQWWEFIARATLNDHGLNMSTGHLGTFPSKKVEGSRNGE
jgi:hypothetical protein